MIIALAITGALAGAFGASSLVLLWRLSVARSRLRQLTDYDANERATRGVILARTRHLRHLLHRREDEISAVLRRAIDELGDSATTTDDVRVLQLRTGQVLYEVDGYASRYGDDDHG